MAMAKIDHRLVITKGHSKSTIQIKDGLKEVMIRTRMVVSHSDHTRKTKMTSHHMEVKGREAMAVVVMTTRKTEEVSEEAQEEEDQVVVKESFQARAVNHWWPFLKIRRMHSSKNCKFTPTNLS